MGNIQSHFKFFTGHSAAHAADHDNLYSRLGQQLAFMLEGSVHSSGLIPPGRPGASCKQQICCGWPDDIPCLLSQREKKPSGRQRHWQWTKKYWSHANAACSYCPGPTGNFSLTRFISTHLLAAAWLLSPAQPRLRALHLSYLVKKLFQRSSWNSRFCACDQMLVLAMALA